jgi:hypothetical protein
VREFSDHAGCDYCNVFFPNTPLITSYLLIFPLFFRLPAATHVKIKMSSSSIMWLRQGRHFLVLLSNFICNLFPAYPIVFWNLVHRASSSLI